MLKVTSILISFLFAAQGIAMSSAPLPTFKIPNSGTHHFKAYVDNEMALHLNSNPSTGFTWQYKIEEPKPKCLRISGQKFLKSNSDEGQNAKPGAAGKQEYIVKFECAGRYKMNFTYSRSWEKNTPPLNETVVEVEVSAD